MATKKQIEKNLQILESTEIFDSKFVKSNGTILIPLNYIATENNTTVSVVKRLFRNQTTLRCYFIVGNFLSRN